MQTRRLLVLAALIATLAPLPAMPQGAKADARPVAIVTEVRGPAWSESPGSKKVEVRPLDWFPVGTVLSTEAGASLVVVFQNGSRTRIGERSALRVTADGARDAKGSVAALSPVPPLPQVASVALEGPATRINAVRVRGETFLRIQPNGGATVLASAARLEFEPVEEHSSYSIAVEREDATVVYETNTAATSVVVPVGVLLPGTPYYWRVATRDNLGRGARASGRFVTLTTEQAAHRQALRAALGSSGADLAFLAEIDRSLGLLREAQSGFELAHTGGASSDRITARLEELDALLPRPR